MKQKFLMWKVRSCKQKPLGEHSNVNWGWSVAEYSPIDDAYNDIAWFATRSAARNYYHLLIQS
jgi:hypothetical protein